MSAPAPRPAPAERPIMFAVKLRAGRDCTDAIKALRSVLKFAWRRHRLKCTEAVQE